MKFKPETKAGKWSVGLSAFFLSTIVTAIILVNGLGLLSYDDHWWDATVPLSFAASIAAFVLGLRALIRHKDKAALVYAAVVVGFLTILFIPLHSLFISD
jgi:hypothetical protein